MRVLSFDFIQWRIDEKQNHRRQHREVCTTDSPDKFWQF